MTPKLTLNIGVRWEYFAPLTERFDRSVSGFDFNAASPVASAAQAAYALNPIPELAGELLSLGTRRGVDRTVGKATAELELRISPPLVVAVQEVGPGFVTKLEVVIAPVDIRCDLTKTIGRKIEVVSDFVVNPTVVVDHDVGKSRLIRIQLRQESGGEWQRAEVERLSSRMQAVTLGHPWISTSIVAATEGQDQAGTQGPDIVHPEGLPHDALVEPGGRVAVIVAPLSGPVIQLGKTTEDPIVGTEGMIHPGEPLFPFGRGSSCRLEVIGAVSTARKIGFWIETHHLLGNGVDSAGGDDVVRKGLPAEQPVTRGRDGGRVVDLVFRSQRQQRR